jgi:hypothetical protein
MHDPQNLQYDEDDRDDEQDMDEIARFGETRADRTAEKAQQPQDQKNDDDSPQHEISPLQWLERAGWPGVKPDEFR